MEKTTKYPQIAQGLTGSTCETSIDLRPMIAPPVTIDFCCGMGGLSLAAQQIGMNVLAGVDLDHDSLKTFSANFPDAIAINETVGGAKAIARCKDALSKHANQQSSPVIVLSGPPCQGFSAAGTRDPGDKRNKVLLGVARAIAAIMPTCAIVENVQELLTEKHRNRVAEFKDKLETAGFHILSVQLNAKDYGVPQKRRRAFFLITRTPLNELIVQRRFTELQMPEISCGFALDSLPPAKIREDKYDDQASIETIPNHLAMRHSKSVQQKIADIPMGRGPMSYRKLDPSRPANTLFSGHRAPPAHYKYPRSITTREAARLQGFPDDFRIYGSFGNQMNQVTNAVPPPLARIVLRVLTEFVDIPLITRL